MISICCNNLEAEMKRIGITRVDIANFLGISYSTVHSRFNGYSQWTYNECVAIRNEFFSGMELEYLFPYNSQTTA